MGFSYFQAISIFRTILLLVLWLVSSSHSIRQHYDFIVVGSGAGGSAVARRLSENGEFTVLLVESGGNPREGSDVPANAPLFLSDSGVTFQYTTVPQRNAALANNGVATMLTGRMLGGSTALNYMWFNRGHPRDWDNWANVTGDQSWSYGNMLKYMKRSESYEGDFRTDQHGYNGPITVSRPRYAPGLEYWLAAGRELGYAVGDSNGPQKVGFSPVEHSHKHGRRVSSFSGYVRPILNIRTNLEVITNTNVTEILFEGNSAIGVRIQSSSSQGLPSDNCLYASKEVIVSAGALNSPLLLQRSGIGPRNVLRAARIPIIKELPVGRNFQDHPYIGLKFFINNASAVMDENRDLTPETWEFYQLFGDGPYSIVRGSSGQAFISSSVAASDGDSDWPDIHMLMVHSVQSILPEQIRQDASNENYSENEVPITAAMSLSRPKSRGTIDINPSDVFGNPILDPGYLTDSRDIQVYVDGIREMLRIFEQTNAYKKLEARLAPIHLPACQRFVFRSNSYWRCYVKQLIDGSYHSSNKMGRRDVPTAVVDTQLRVIGINRLRVVDASIMPFVPNATPQAVVYAIAEKASDMILKSWIKI